MEAFELPFVAPVPWGHDVLVVFARSELALARLILDETAHLLYCDSRLWGPLGTDPRATVDPVGVLSVWAWHIERAVRGRSLGAMISTFEPGDSPQARTRLFIEPATPTSPFR